MTPTLVMPEHVRDIWPRIGPIVARVIPYMDGRYGITDIYEEIELGNQQLWVVIDDDDDDKIVGVVTTKISDFPSKRLLSGIVCAGDRLEEWAPITLELLNKFGKEYGRKGFQMSGRKGWVRFMKKLGFEERFVTIVKDYDDV